ncbi:hypothetical protein SNE40_001390 [Patella caerulea]|uniref:Uncharacterized protein n=1 Tax=Patella caerulea TaxID=87958 RepID=A0AAN8KHE2_PATCE
MMKIPCVVFGALCLMVLISPSEAACYGGPKNPPGADLKCSTEIGELDVGETRRDYNKCNRYYCGEIYYSVCGIGYNAGITEVDGCSLVKQEYCCYQFFSDTDPTKSCTEQYCP